MAFSLAVFVAAHTLGEVPHVLVVAARLWQQHDRAAAAVVGTIALYLLDHSSGRLSQLCGAPWMAVGAHLSRAVGEVGARLLPVL